MAVYFAQLSTGAIKIGSSDNVPARMDQLRAHYGEEPSLLFVMDGGRQTEREMHERFAAYRLGRTEQFRPAPELMAYIGRPLLVGVNPNTVEATEPKSYVPGRNDVAVKLERNIISMAKAIATRRGIPVSEFLSDIARGPVGQAYARMLRDLEKKGDAS